MQRGEADFLKWLLDQQRLDLDIDSETTTNKPSLPYLWVPTVCLLAHPRGRKTQQQCMIFLSNKRSKSAICQRAMLFQTPPKIGPVLLS